MTRIEDPMLVVPDNRSQQLLSTRPNESVLTQPAGITLPIPTSSDTPNMNPLGAPLDQIPKPKN